MDKIYIASYGNDEQGNGSKTQPFKTLEQSIRCLNDNGEIYILETYPSQVSIKLVWVELLEASIIEFEVLEVPNETRKELVAKDPTYQIASVNTDKVIDEDYNFKSFEELDAGSLVYGTLISGVNCLCVESLFSFNPR